MATNDVAQARITYAQGDELRSNLFAFRALNDDASLESLILSWTTTPNDPLTALRACISSRLTVVDITCKYVWPPGLLPEETGVIGLAGTLSGSSDLPFAVAPLVSWRTGFQGRRNRGRSYLPSPTTTTLLSSAQTWTGTYVTALTTFRDRMITRFVTSAAEWKLCIYSPTNAAEDPLSLPVVDVDFGLVDTIPRTIRRRYAKT